MANFTDAIQQFNPYIQQLPVDEYTRAGIFKQQAYNQGVQRVQSYIDQVSSLPVVGNANVALLEQKMGELRGKLQGVLSADFSKASLQNQVGSLAMQIAKDPAVQASITAGSLIKSAEQSIQDARKSGKGYSDANAAYLHSAIQEYLNASNTEAGLSYNGPTTIHSVTMDQIHEKVQKAIAPLKDSWDSNFDVKFDPSGRVMISSEDKSLDAEKVKSAINAVLTADDYKAMGIAGWYNNQGKSDEEVVGDTLRIHTRIANHHKQMKEKYLGVVNGTEELTQEEEAKYRQLADNHSTLEKEYVNYLNQTKNSYEKGQYNREGISGDIVKETMMNGYAGAYQFYREGEQKYQVSPYHQIAMDEAKLAIEREKLAIEREKNEREKKAEGLLGYLTPSPTDATKSNNVVTTQDLSNQISGVREGIKPGGDIQEEELKQWAAATDVDPVTGIRQYKLVTEDGQWVNGKAKEEALKNATEYNANRHALSQNPEFVGTIPGYRRAGAEAKFNTNVKSNIAGQNIRTDAYIEGKVLKDNPELAKKIGGSVNIDGQSYKIKDLLNIYYESTKEGELKSYGGMALNNPTKTRELISGSKADKIGFSKIQKVLADNGFNEKELMKKKDILYREAAEAMQPYEFRPVLGSSDKQKVEYETYRSIVMESDELKANGIAKESISNNDITISGMRREKDGRIVIRATIKDKGEVIVDTKQSKLDIGNNEALKDFAIVRNFYSDKYPELTESLRRPGSGFKTVGEEQGFKGALFIKNNSKVARYVQVVYDKDRNGFRVFSFKPLGNGQYKKIEPASGELYTNAGVAIDAIERFYAMVTNEYDVNALEKEFLDKTSQ